jgi:hypothetical protein
MGSPSHSSAHFCTPLGDSPFEGAVANTPKRAAHFARIRKVAITKGGASRKIEFLPLGRGICNIEAKHGAWRDDGHRGE